MRQDIAFIWTEALRSNEYAQCRKMLHRKDDGFCCLGVLTDLYLKAHPDAPRWVDGPTNEWNIVQMQVNLGGDSMNNVHFIYGFLPKKVIEWSGMSHALGVLNPDSGRNLAQLNDDGIPFAQIADIIEKNMEIL